jgi:hypothetical protein
MEWRTPPATRLALAIAIVAIPAAAASGEVSDRTATAAAICRGYAAAQHALPYDTMYAQCMYARGYVVPGFSPSPDSPGYQGELPGPGGDRWRPLELLSQGFDLTGVGGTGEKLLGYRAITMQAAPFHPT